MMSDIDVVFQTEIKAILEKYNIILQEASKEINRLKGELLQCKENEKRLATILIQKKKRTSSQAFSTQSQTTPTNSKRQKKRNIHNEQECHHQQQRKQGLFSKLTNYGYC